MNFHENFMWEAFKEARKGYEEGGIPIGAVLVKQGKIISRGHNRRVQENSPILHAEMDCLNRAGRLQSKDYQQLTIYTTLSPCEMCTGALLFFKIPTIVIGENKTFKGSEEHLKSRGREVIILDLDYCKEIMEEFISHNPELWAEDVVHTL